MVLIVSNTIVRTTLMAVWSRVLPLTTTVQTFNSCASRPDVCQCLVVQTLIYNTDPCSLQIKATLSCEVRSLWSHPCPDNWVAVGCVGMYYARAAPALSTGIKCRHCSCSCGLGCCHWLLQCRHLIPAPVDRTSASAWLYKHLYITVTHVACKSKLR